MVAKKRSRLRSKAAARSAGILKTVDSGSLVDLPEDPKAFLHQYKETKKEKHSNKQNEFLSRIKKGSNGDASFDGISKSSIRRRKRKMRDDLKPRLDDLLTSLQQEEDLDQFTRENTDLDLTGSNTNENAFIKDIDPPAMIQVTKIVEKVEPGSVKIRKNEPNIRNKKGATMLAAKERERFNEVITNQVFKQNSFSALREIIKMQKR